VILLGDCLVLFLIVPTLPGLFELVFLTVGAILESLKRQPLDSKQTKEVSKLVVIIPAYNEEHSIQRTINSLKSCSGSFDIVVVADNCTDQTAVKSRQCGVRVLERFDSKNKGKNHALLFAFEQLLNEEFHYFLIIDADTVVSSNLIDVILSEFAKGADAVQVFYGTLNFEQSLRLRLMKISYLAMNLIRPLGRQFWGFSTGILGNGIALSRSTLLAVPFHVNSIVEDLAYHVMLVKARKRVKFTSRTEVYAEMPLNKKAMTMQRLRWEGGRIRTSFKELPTLFRLIFQGHTKIIEPCLDLLTWPLSYLVLFLLVLLFVPYSLVKLYAIGGIFIIFLHILAGMKIGHCQWKDYLALVSVPFYLIWKFLMLGKMIKILWKGSPWNRTPRNNDH
jgi:cellulose synthase/poly-beta-1,6-N-acetylglucosamine synthase-like glycosyltransferase